MSQIIASIGDLNSFAGNLSGKAAQFGALLSSMEATVNSVSSSWKGSDANAFVANAKAYLQNLKVIEAQLNNYSNCVKSCSSKYSNRLADFYSILGG